MNRLDFTDPDVLADGPVLAKRREEAHRAYEQALEEQRAWREDLRSQAKTWAGKVTRDSMPKHPEVVLYPRDCEQTWRNSKIRVDGVCYGAPYNQIERVVAAFLLSQGVDPATAKAAAEV